MQQTKYIMMNFRAAPSFSFRYFIGYGLEIQPLLQHPSVDHLRMVPELKVASGTGWVGPFSLQPF